MKHLEEYLENIKRTVIIADDEAENREVLGRILEDDYNVFFAEDGVRQIQQDALEHFMGRGVRESKRHYLRGADAQAQELDIAFGQAESFARAGGGDDGAVGYHWHSSSSTEAKRSSADISQKKR